MTKRNEKCPCGSGRKFKKCCLGKPTGTKLAALMDDAAYEDWERGLQPDELSRVNQRRRNRAGLVLAAAQVLSLRK